MHDELNNLIANQIATLNAGGMECVHQMRVVLRRMNATLMLFKDVIASQGTGESPKEHEVAERPLGHGAELGRL